MLPEPVVERLVKLSRILSRLDCDFISSANLERITSWSSNTIRKDISFLNNQHASNKGYPVKELQANIDTALGLSANYNFCIIGLGRLGSAFLNYSGFEQTNCTPKAGFETSIDRLEVLSTPVQLFPSFKMAEIIPRYNIGMPLLCVPADQAERVSKTIIQAGIRAIINFAPIVLEAPGQVLIQNIYLGDELRYLAARLHQLTDTTGLAKPE